MYRIIENTKLNSFAKSLAKMVCQATDITMKDVKKFISVKSIKGLIEQHSDKAHDGVLVNEEILDTICADIYFWVKGCFLAKKAADDELDCYWDSKMDCMVFRDKVDETKKKGFKKKK